MTPSIMAAGRNPNPEVIATLLNAGAKIDDRAGNGRTSLMEAAMANENPEVISILLKAGAKLDDKDPSGRTPLMWAAWQNHNPKVIMTLLKAGADGKLKCDDKTAFDYAVGNDKLQGTDAYEALRTAAGE